MSPEKITADEFYAVIEIEKGGKNKYELDKDTGMLKLDRVLYTSTHYPANYGFIPRTWAEDNDPLDVLVLCSESIQPMTLVSCKPRGVIKMNDQGELDEKIIAVCIIDPFYNGYEDISQLPSHIDNEMRHFFEVYKTVENKDTTVQVIEGREQAKEVINKAINAYKRLFVGGRGI